ncbi:hypothetical protein [Aquimarina latercula]|uniref:hypothetical protein n=1 Tax=Aquimarina latercula TaxID=987 RepID=UPI0012DE7C07|nr:hypothetical protein [Aquimarina latercula]
MMMSLLFCSYTVIAQEEEEEEEIIEEVEEISEEPTMVKAVFDAYEGGMFSFNYKTEDGDDDVIFFNHIKPEVLKLYDLKSKKFSGKTFEIIYETVEEEEIDDDGDKQYNRVRTITVLKLLS